MNDHTRHFVHDQKVLVLIDDIKWYRPWFGSTGWRFSCIWKYTHFITSPEYVAGLADTLVDEDLSICNQLLHCSTRDIAQNGCYTAVNSLTYLFFSNMPGTSDKWVI